MKPREHRGRARRKALPPAAGITSEITPEARATSGSDSAGTDWGHVADWYDQLVGDAGSEYHREVVLPGVLRLLSVGPGDHVLDLACGQGVFCRMLQQRGVNVTGIDAAPELVRLAKERSDPAITYLVADARHLADRPELPAHHFRAIACVLAIQDLDPLAPVFAHVARLLQPGGRFVVAMTHPCFRVPKASGWDWDSRKNLQYRRVEHYLTPRKEKITTHPGAAPGRFTWTFHRPLQSYVKALHAAGLLIDALEEWSSHKRSDSGPRAAAENTARKEIPLFLALRMVKINPG